MKTKEQNKLRNGLLLCIGLMSIAVFIGSMSLTIKPFGEWLFIYLFVSFAYWICIVQPILDWWKNENQM